MQGAGRDSPIFLLKRWRKSKCNDRTTQASQLQDTTHFPAQSLSFGTIDQAVASSKFMARLIDLGLIVFPAHRAAAASRGVYIESECAKLSPG